MKAGWERKKLGDISKINYGYTEKASFEIDGPKFLRITDIQDNSVDWEKVPSCKITDKDFKKFRLSDGDIVFARTGATTGKSYLVRNPKESVFASYLIKLSVKDRIALPDFLQLFFQTKEYWDRITSGIAGSTQGGFNASKLAELNIPLPPLSEQRRIVAILEEAFAGIAAAKEKAEQNLKNAKEVFDAYSTDIFSSEKAGWETNKLQDVVDSSCSLSYGIVQPGEEFQDGLPIVRPVDLTNKFITLQGLKYINPALAESYKRTTLSGNEILMCVRGNTGVISIASQELKGANVTRGIVPIRFDSMKVNKLFGFYALCSNYVQKQIKAKTYGAALMQINISDLRKINIHFPKEQEQRQIVSQLDGLSEETSRLESIYQQKISDLEELKKSVLQQAFSGAL